MSNLLTPTLLAELVCTRISHDIVGNVGAVANAVELLEEGDLDFLDDIKSILKTSSSVLSARMKFFRLAFGLDNANLENLAMIKSAAEDYLATIGNRNYPIKLDFSLTDVRYARIVLLAVMIIADTLIRGGNISVAEKDGQVWVVSQGDVPPSADKLACLKQIVGGQNIEPNAQLAPVFYLLAELSAKGSKVFMVNSNFAGFMFASDKD